MTWLWLNSGTTFFLRKTWSLPACLKEISQRTFSQSFHCRPSSLAGRIPQRDLLSRARSPLIISHTTNCQSAWRCTPTWSPIKWAAPLAGLMPTAPWPPAAPCWPCTGMWSSWLEWSASHKGQTAPTATSSRKCHATSAGCRHSWIHEVGQSGRINTRSRESDEHIHCALISKPFFRFASRTTLELGLGHHYRSASVGFLMYPQGGSLVTIIERHDMKQLFGICFVTCRPFNNLQVMLFLATAVLLDMHLVSHK